MFALQVRWRINSPVLDVVKSCLKQKVEVGDLPVASNIDVPPPPEGLITNVNGRLMAPPQEEFEDDEAFKERVDVVVAYRRTVDKVTHLLSPLL